MLGGSDDSEWRRVARGGRCSRTAPPDPFPASRPCCIRSATARRSSSTATGTARSGSSSRRDGRAALGGPPGGMRDRAAVGRRGVARARAGRARRRRLDDRGPRLLQRHGGECDADQRPDRAARRRCRADRPHDARLPRRGEGRAAAHDARDRPRRAGHHRFPAQGARRALPARRSGTGSGAASNREIAAALFVSVETVETHMRTLFDAFAVGDVPQYHKRTELVRRALETGLVTRSRPRALTARISVSPTEIWNFH